MRKVSALLYLLAFTVPLLVISCQKGPDDTVPEENCRVSKAYYFNLNGDIADSMVYTYTGDTLTKISNADGYFTFEYSNNKITKRNYFESGYPDVVAYDIFSYNTDGTIATIKTYEDFLGQVTQFLQHDFEYAGGKLTRFELQEYSFNSNQLELHESTAYTYTGNNITKAVFTDHSINGTLEYTYTYSYDNNENYFTRNKVLLADAFFFEGLDGTTIPLLKSANNATSANDGYEDYPITYKLNGQKNLFEFYTGGDIDSRYLYECK